MANEIVIRVHQGEYVGGDTIFGNVYVNLKENIQSRTLKLQVRGIETTMFDYTYTEAIDENEYRTKTGVKKGEKVFLNEDHRMIEYPRGFSKGCYSFPFQYQLPHGVPGVFNIKRDEDRTTEGTIRYTIGATFSNPSTHPKLQTEIPLIVYDSIECRNAEYVPSKQSSSDRVQYLVCFNRGTIQLTTRLNKTAYCSDETIKLHIDVDNQSSIDVSGVTITLNRVLRIFGRDTDRGDENELTDHIDFITLATQHHSMIANGTKESWEECVDLKDCQRLPPTTGGSIVRCRYHLDIKLHCTYSLDIDQVQHVIIMPHKNVSWSSWEPPPWIDSCTVSQVIAPLAVNRDILYSNAFTNIPGYGNSWRTTSFQQ